jgi:predicted O-methyltransferase YrrM
LRKLLPRCVRARLRASHREVVLRRAMKRFVRDPAACRHPGNPLLRDLVYGWGNEGYSAREEYLAACIDEALRSDGPILECGSGISTLLVGHIATKRRQRYWALEHLPEWAARVRRYLDRYSVDSVIVCTTPLHAYGSFSWYKPPLAAMPQSLHLVICDGPPGATMGGRYGFVPILRERLRPGCVILLDDAEREEERIIATRWAQELGASLQILGSAKPYIRLTLENDTGRREARAGSLPNAARG